MRLRFTPFGGTAFSNTSTVMLRLPSNSSRAYFLKQLGYVDCTLRENGHFLMGEEFTIADIMLTTCLTWAKTLGVPIHDHCCTYLETITARDAYQAALAANARRSKSSQES